MKLSVSVRNAQLAAYETTIGTAPKMRVLTGAQPADCAASQTGTLLAELSLPADFMAAPVSGEVGLLGSWSGTVVADGVAAYYRILDSSGTTCHEQGSVSTTGADINLTNTSLTTGQVLVITNKTITAGNA